MEENNDELLIVYEESKEIKELLWKIWDLLNDMEIINKLILNSSLIDELEKSYSQILFNLKDNKGKEQPNKSNNNNKIDKNGKFNNLYNYLFLYRYNNKF